VGRLAAVEAPRALLIESGAWSVELDRYECTLEATASYPRDTRVPPLRRPRVEGAGRGVLVGIVDGGVHVLSGVFGPDGEARIEGVLDLRDGLEVEYSRSEIRAIRAAGRVRADRRLSQHTHADWHGTAVASIAAGAPILLDDGTGFEGGVAPSAALAFVALPFDGSRRPNASDLVRALAYLEQLAGDRPLVVNMSFGMSQGSADGNSLAECACDEFTEQGRRPGRILVKAAGNSALGQQCASVSVGQGVDRVIGLEVRPGMTYLELWFDPTIGIAVGIEVDQRSSSTSLGKLEGDDGVLSADWEDGCVAARVAPVSPLNGESAVVMTISARRAADVRLIVAATRDTGGAVYASLSGAARFHPGSEPTSTITCPGASRSVLTVGGVQKSFVGGVQVAATSGRGPTRDGRAKPEFVAPSVAHVPDEAGRRQVAEGTSFASPVVAGYVACHLSRCLARGAQQPNLRQMLGILRRCASAKWSADVGYGQIDPDRLFAT
jgi:subtilisin family serine protease